MYVYIYFSLSLSLSLSIFFSLCLSLSLSLSLSLYLSLSIYIYISFSPYISLLSMEKRVTLSSTERRSNSSSIDMYVYIYIYREERHSLLCKENESLSSLSRRGTWSPMQRGGIYHVKSCHPLVLCLFAPPPGGTMLLRFHVFAYFVSNGGIFSSPLSVRLSVSLSICTRAGYPVATTLRLLRPFWAGRLAMKHFEISFGVSA